MNATMRRLMMIALAAGGSAGPGNVSVNRFYTFASAPAISPAFSAEWNRSTGATRIQLRTVDGNSAVNASNTGSGTSGHNTLIAQAVSGPLVAQTISGTVKGRLRALETLATDEYFAQLRIKVVSNDGSVVRGVLLEVHAEAVISSEFATSLTNRSFPLLALSPAALTPVDAEAGDRLVVELGYKQLSTSTSNATLSVESVSATDLAENETTTAAQNPWIEFSNAITVQA